MFAGCESLQKLNVNNLDTSNVIKMFNMFSHCKSLQKLDVSHFDTKNVGDMDCMFRNCQSLEELDLSGFDTSNGLYMREMFSECHSLKKLNVSGFDTSKVSNMTQMFYNCYALKELDLSNFNTEKANTSSMFSECRELERIKTPKTSFTATLPAVYLNECWIDSERNIYSGNTSYTFDKTTEICRIKEKYNINYVTQGELINCPTQYKVVDGIAELGIVKHPYGTFQGWYLDQAYTLPITAIEKGTWGDITLYEKIIPNTYTITYMYCDDILNKENLPTKYTYGIELVIPKPQKHCFVFQGWYLNEECTKPITKITKTTGGNLNLYPKWEVKHDIDRQNGQVLKPATETETGLIQYTCKNCSYTITEELPKIETKPGSTEEAILNNGDNDIKGSSFSLIQARAEKTTKNSIHLKWNKVKGADGYMVYGNKCNPKNKYEPIQMITSGDITTFTHKNRKKNTYYKYTIYAYKLVNGKREKVAVSKTVHATTKSSKYGNAKSVKVNKTKVTLKKKKTFKLKCSEVAEKGRKVHIHRGIKYESSNTKIATVSNKGVIKAKKKGTCYVYAYAQNGVYKKIKVTVK